MNDSLEDISGAPPPAPHRDRAAHRESEIPNRLPRYVSLLIVLAATSTGVGYQVARLEIAGAGWFHTAPSMSMDVFRAPGVKPASNPPRYNIDSETISQM